MGRKNSPPRRAPEICPVCGEDVPRGAPACPGCGADHNSGWREDAEGYDALPDDSFKYEEFVAREFGAGPKPAGIQTIWWVTAIIVIVVVLLTYFYAAR